MLAARPLSIGIIGAGIAGLSAAIAMGARGHQVVVYEAASELHEIGAGLQLSPNATRLLCRMRVNLGSAFAPRAIEMRAGKSAKLVALVPLGASATDRWGGQYLHMHRADLQAALLDRAQRGGAEIRLGQRIEAPDLPAHDYLIAADGVHSALRSALVGDQPRFAGTIAFRALVPRHELAAPPPDATIIWTGQAQHAVTTRLRDGDLVNFVGMVRAPHDQSTGWRREASRSDVAARFTGWHPCLRQIIDRAEIIHQWALAERAPLNPSHIGNVIFVGDAAHPMLPSYAQGAVQAIEDAVFLAALIDQPNGLATYDALRHPRVAKVAGQSRQNLDRFHRPAMLRSAEAIGAKLIMAVDPEYFSRRLDWLYGYDAYADAQAARRRGV